MKLATLLLPLVGAPSLASATSKGLLRGSNPSTAAAPADLSRRLTWTNPTLGAHHDGDAEEPTTGNSCTVSAEIASPCNMWAFVNGQSLDATMGVSDGASHSSLALSGNTSSVTLVLKSFCTGFSFPTTVVGGDPVPQPMVGATFDVCGTPIPTDDTWVCINHFPEEGSWSSPSFDDSAWPPAVTVEGHGLPPNLTYIAGSPESSDGGAGGGWETFCRKTVPLPGSTGGDAAAPPAPPAPIVPATPALPLSPPVWITRVVVEGNCSLVDADLHDLSVNFGFLVGLKEELGFPPCNCTLLGHHPAPALAKPTDSAWPCAHVKDPCLFNYSFSGPQDWLTEEMLEEAIHDPTFSTIFDTRNSSSSEFCEVQEIITDLPPIIPETGEEPPLITHGPLPLRPNTSIPAIPPTPAVPGDGSNDSSVSVPAPPAPISPPDAPTPAGDSPADSSVSGPSPPAPAAPVSPPPGSGSNDSSVSVPGRPVDGVPSTTTDTPVIEAPNVPAGDSPADSSVSVPGRPVPSTTEPAVDTPVTPPTQIPVVPPVTSVDSPVDPASPPTAPVAPSQGAGGEDDAIPPPTIAQPALPSGGAPEVPDGGEDEVPPPAISRPPAPPATDDTIDSSVPGPVRPLPPTTPTTPTEPEVDTPETPALAPPAETPAVPAVPAVDSPAEPVSPPDAPALPGDDPVDDVPFIPPQAAGGEDEAIPPPLTNDEPALPTTDDTDDSSISPPTRPTEPTTPQEGVPSTGDSPPIVPPTDIPAAPTPPSETANPQEPDLPTVPEITDSSVSIPPTPPGEVQPSVQPGDSIGPPATPGNDSSVSIPPVPTGEVQPSVQPGNAIGPPATSGNDSSVSIPPAPTGDVQPSVQPSDSVAPPSIPEAGEDSSVSIPPQASNSGSEEAPQPQPAASNDPGVEPAPEPLANGGVDSSVAPPQASNSGGEEAPQPQPAASEDSGAPAMPEPQPAASNDDGGAVAVEPAVTSEEPLEFPTGPATVVACGETVTFELASEGPGALFQVEAMGDGDVAVRATTCVEGTQVDTIVSLYDSNPSEGAAPVASNDNDASCARDPTFSTVSTVMPDGSTIYMHVVNNGVEAGGVSLKVHCGVYNRSHLEPGGKN